MQSMCVNVSRTDIRNYRTSSVVESFCTQKTTWEKNQPDRYTFSSIGKFCILKNQQVKCQHQHKNNTLSLSIIWHLTGWEGCGAERDDLSPSALYWIAEGHVKVKTDVQNGWKSLIFRLSGCEWLGGRWSLCQRRKMAGAADSPPAGLRAEMTFLAHRIQNDWSDQLLFSLYLQETQKWSTFILSGEDAENVL